MVAFGLLYSYANFFFISKKLVILLV